jgi:hypothetical protein
MKKMLPSQSLDICREARRNFDTSSAVAISAVVYSITCHDLDSNPTLAGPLLCHRGKGRIGCVEALGLVCIAGRQLMSEERERMTTDAERQTAVDIVGRIV